MILLCKFLRGSSFQQKILDIFNPTVVFSKQLRHCEHAINIPLPRETFFHYCPCPHCIPIPNYFHLPLIESKPSPPRLPIISTPTIPCGHPNPPPLAVRLLLPLPSPPDALFLPFYLIFNFFDMTTPRLSCVCASPPLQLFGN